MVSACIFGVRVPLQYQLPNGCSHMFGVCNVSTSILNVFVCVVVTLCARLLLRLYYCFWLTYHPPECRLEFSIHLYIIIICYMNFVCALDVVRCSYTHSMPHTSSHIILCSQFYVSYCIYKIRISVSLLAACCFVFFFRSILVLMLISSFIRRWLLIRTGLSFTR